MSAAMLGALPAGAQAPNAQVPRAQVTEPPLYRLTALLDPSGHTIRAELRVSVPAEDPRPRDEWWFHLPPNRFAAEDPRGPRRETDSVPFGFSFLGPLRIDPLFPAGYSAGSIRVLAVSDGAGRPLDFRLEANPLLPEGFHAGEALLRVTFGAGSAGSEVRIEFETHLPQRYWDGWSAAGVFAERWHPVLLEYRGGQWLRDVGEPTPGRYEAAVTSLRGGTLVLPDTPPVGIRPGIPVAYPLHATPLRSFPLIFLHRAETVSIDHGGIRIVSAFPAGHERIGALLVDIAAEFLDFLETSFGLVYPKRSLTLVQFDALSGDPRTASGTVAVPLADYEESRLLDRVLVGRVSRAIARQWFGETLWVGETEEAWLAFGPAGYLSLAFFDFLYGADAPTHTLTDWLAPRYREHYFEEPVRQLIRLEEDAPLVLHRLREPKERTVRVVIHHKAPLVVGQLEYVMDERPFRKGLRRFVRRQSYRRVTTESFRQAMESAAERDLGWFFDDWVRRATPLDYALEDVREEITGSGTRLLVSVVRLQGGRMPVEVRVATESGEPLSRRWDGVDRTTTLIFHTRSPVVRVVLDPDERLLEIDRQNNYSEANVRVRPIFDWAKNREMLVSLHGRAGGNAIDGNYVGLGVNVNADPDNQFYFLPGYGQESESLIFDVGWTHRRLFVPRLSFTLRRTRIGGRDILGFGLTYQHDTPERMALYSTVEYRLERVDELPADQTVGSALQSPGDVNNLNVFEEFFVQPNGPTYHGATLEFERSTRGFDSDFEYTLARGTLLNGFQLAHNHQLELEVIRGGIDGEAPVQKKLLLGDPLVLRGYPRSLRLLSDQLIAVRLDYRYVFSRTLHGREVQSRKLTAILFVDAGKGWNNGERPSDRSQRQDYGVGLEVELDFLNQVAFPLRIEVARPFNDPDFRDTQFVFFQALAFF
ncbi:MAG: M1 family aminopeptidase [SAR324 cluster bacterium]|nr:M1 family aminopeptidase [SAR324 cluster bacterium]